MRSDGAPGRWVVEVRVRPKEGVNDPEGEAILGGLRGLGFGEVAGVQAGRLFRLTIRAADGGTATALATAACDRLLANPVVERYELGTPERDELERKESGGRGR